jgi:uncharacterized membrane protein YesL
MLKKIFDFENPFMQALSTAADLLILNLFTILCCLPVVTAGAAWAALNDVVYKMVKHEETYPYRMFFQAFRANLKKGIPLGLIFIGAAVLVYLNYLAASMTLPPFRYLSVAVGMLVLAIGNYAFALTARFENTVKGTLKNAWKLAIGWFPRTLGMVVFETVVFVAGIHFYSIGLPLLFLFGFSVPCYVCALLYAPVFKRLEENQEE